MRRFILAMALVLLMSSCGWHQKSESVSPNGVNRVALLQQRVLEMGGGLQIRFIAGSQTVHAKKLIGDVYLNFIELRLVQRLSQSWDFYRGYAYTGICLRFCESKRDPV